MTMAPDRFPDLVSPEPSVPAVEIFAASMEDLGRATDMANANMPDQCAGVCMLALLRLALWRFEFDYGASWPRPENPLAPAAMASDNPPA